MAKKASKKRSRLGGGGLQDLVEGGQQLVSQASGRAEDVVKRVQKTVQEAVAAVEKRSETEIKNLRGRLKDLNISVGGLEKQYRSLERRVEKQLRGTDLEKRIRSLEADFRRMAGLSAAKPAAANKPVAKKATTTRKRTTAKRRKPATRRKPASTKAATTRPSSNGQSST